MRLIYVAGVAVLLSSATTVALAQGRVRQPSSSGKTQIPPTDVSVVLLTTSTVSGVSAQQWGSTFAKLRVSVRIRPPVGDDRPEVTETRRGRTRYVSAVGELKRDGSIVFPGRRFRSSDAARLAEWIRELKTYGAQGSTDGKPGFGLSPQQFTQVFAALEAPVTRSLEGLTLDRSLAGVELPESLPLKLSVEAEEQLRSNPPPAPAPDGLAGMSRGAALGILLNSAGLGFHPGRTPRGTLELTIVPLGETAAVWPIGWPLERAPLHTMPKLVEVIPVTLDEVPLTDVLTAASVKTGISIQIDTHRIEAAGIQLERLKVSQPPKKMTWSGLLDRATFPHLMRELLQDEAGEPFIWVTTRTVKQLNDRNRQREEFEKLRK
jgi:hypothetical protein